MEENSESPESLKLRELMRKLRREGAPWFLEARLMQRISGESRPSVRARLRPAIALPVAAVFAGALLYISWPDSPEATRESGEGDSSFPTGVGTSGEIRSPGEEPVIDELGIEYRPTEGSPGRGPSGGSIEPFLPSPIIAPNVILDTQSFRVSSTTLIADSSDSLQRRADSLRKRDQR